MDILALPDDVLREVLSYVDIKSLIMFTSTTKHVHGNGLEMYKPPPVHFNSWASYILTRIEICRQAETRRITRETRHAAIDAIMKASLQWEKLRLPSDRKMLQEFRRDLIDLPLR